jgi:hypothetical protein
MYDPLAVGGIKPVPVDPREPDNTRVGDRLGLYQSHPVSSKAIPISVIFGYAPPEYP